MNRWLRVRLGFVFICCAGFFCLVAIRLVQLQVLPNGSLEELSKKQFHKTGKKLPDRAAIFDRNGEELAITLPASSVFARPKLIKYRRRTAVELAKVFGGTPARWLEKLDPQKPFVWIQRQVSPEISDKLSKMNIPGVFLEAENKRMNPNDALAEPIIGVTDIDGKGISGLELILDKELLDLGAKYAVLRDGKGIPAYIDRRYKSASDSKPGVQSTIDRRVQSLVEEELVESQKRNGAKGLHAIVMDPFTGEIIAMAQWSAIPDSYGINHNISNLYEPGSLLKVLFAAEAIETGVMHPQTMIDCGMGKITVNGQVLGEAESDHRYGLLPLEKVIRYSSNVGAVKVAQALGQLKVRATVEKYGLTSKTQIQLPGEAFSSMKQKESWTPLLNATVGFGQGISMTPLQMVASIAPFANGGYWVRPKILKSEVGSTNAERQELRRVLSAETVKKMRHMLIGVTEGKDGTGVLAKIPGFHVAGKTGTAQKYEAGVGYRSGKYFSSFVGFLPADNPQILVGVMVDEPKAPYYASQTAAPLFRKIAERTIQVMDRVPTETMVADFAKPAKKSKKVEREDVPQLILSGDGKIVMPNLKGLSLKETLQLLGKHFQDLKISGAGYLQSQQPSAGALIQPQTPVELTFTPNG